MNEDLTILAIILGILHSGLRLATPYIYAAIGETFSQKAGVLNLGVDGIMLMGAFSGFYAVFEIQELVDLGTLHSSWVGIAPWMGLLAAGLIGGLMGLILCVVSITFQAEQGISGIGLYMFGLGMSSLLFKTLIGSVEGVTGFPTLRFCMGDFCLADLPVVGELLFNYNLMTYGAYLLVPVAWYVFNRTTWGLKIRAVGQNPEAADSVGVNVNRVRYAAVTVGGVLAGIAGASLSISLLNIFQENMTNGIGFIAVALVYFGSWRASGVLLGALLFSIVNALQLWGQVLGLNIPSDVAVMLPYLLTIFVLALPFRRSTQPKALTKPYARGES